MKFLCRCFLAFLTWGVLSPTWSTDAPPKKVVEVLSVQSRPLRESVRLFGRVRARLDYTHIAEADGVLGQTLIAGQSLKKGQVFATIEDPKVKGTYELAQKSEAIALEQHQRSQTLLGKKAISQKKAESDRALWLEAKQRSLQARMAYDKTQFRAPFDGVLGVFKQREGSYLQKGDRIVTIYNPDTLVVEVDIPEKYVRSLSSQSRVEVAGRTYPLTQLQKVVDPTTNMAPSYVDLGSARDLIPGAIVEVDLILSKKAQVLAIPKESLFIEGDHRFVYLIQEGKTVKREVTLGPSEGDIVAVTTGLKAGDQIVFKNPSRLSPEEDVTILEEATPKTEAVPQSEAAPDKKPASDSGAARMEGSL